MLLSPTLTLFTLFLFVLEDTACCGGGELVTTPTPSHLSEVGVCHPRGLGALWAAAAAPVPLLPDLLVLDTRPSSLLSQPDTTMQMPPALRAGGVSLLPLHDSL